MTIRNDKFSGVVNSTLIIVTKNEDEKIVAATSYTIPYETIKQAKEAARRFIKQFDEV